MKVKLNVGIYGVPARLNLTAKILYGSKEQFEAKVFRRSFSLDKGGDVTFSPEFFTGFIKREKLEVTDES